MCGARLIRLIKVSDFKLGFILFITLSYLMPFFVVIVESHFTHVHRQNFILFCCVDVTSRHSIRNFTVFGRFDVIFDNISRSLHKDRLKPWNERISAKRSRGGRFGILNNLLRFSYRRETQLIVIIINHRE